MRVVGDLHCLLRRMCRLIAMGTEESRYSVQMTLFAEVRISVICETHPLIPQHTGSADPPWDRELPMASDANLQVNHSAPPSPRQQAAQV